MTVTDEDGDSLFTAGLRARVLQQLLHYVDSHVELTRHLARALGVHTTDAVAVAEVLWAQTIEAPLSPARLSARIGLTSGATATLLNRLEASGHLVRSREGTDRRVVTLRLTPKAREDTSAFFLPSGQDIDRIMDGYDRAELERVEHLLADLVAALRARNAHLERRSTSATDHRPSAGTSAGSSPGEGEGAGRAAPRRAQLGGPL